MSSSQDLIKDFRSATKKSFKMIDLELLHYFLESQIMQTESGIFISQQKYATDLIERFSTLGCKEAATPANSNEKLQSNDGLGDANAKRYRSLIGDLIYLSYIQPDIMYAVSLVLRFMAKPSKHHFRAAKRIMRYIARTTDYGIWYGATNELKLQGFANSDWAGSVDDRRSTLGKLFTLGSGAVIWSSKKQSVTSLSTTEAE